MIEVFKSLYGFAWVVKDGGSTSRTTCCFFSSQEKLFLQLGKNDWIVREKMNGRYTKKSGPRVALFYL